MDVHQPSPWGAGGGIAPKGGAPGKGVVGGKPLEVDVNGEF